MGWYLQVNGRMACEDPLGRDAVSLRDVGCALGQSREVAERKAAQFAMAQTVKCDVRAVELPDGCPIDRAIQDADWERMDADEERRRESVGRG